MLRASNSITTRVRAYLYYQAAIFEDLLLFFVFCTVRMLVLHIENCKLETDPLLKVVVIPKVPAGYPLVRWLLSTNFLLPLSQNRKKRNLSINQQLLMLSPWQFS